MLSEPNLLQGVASAASTTSVPNFYHNPLVKCLIWILNCIQINY
jgi:hypothetical protein